MKRNNKHSLPYLFFAVLICLCTVVSSCTKSNPISDPTASSVLAYTESETSTTSEALPATTSQTDTSSATSINPATTTPPVATITPAEYKPVEAQEVEDLPPPITSTTDGTDTTPDAPYESDGTLNIVPDNLPYTQISQSQYYAYNQLTATQKAVYAEMRVYVEDMQAGGYIQQRCSNNDLLIAYEALLTDNPQYFWLSRSFIYGSEGIRKIIYFQIDYQQYSVDYIVTKQQALNIAAQMKSKITGIFNAMSSTLTEFERELYLHDWICANTEYGNKAVTDYDGHMYAFSSYGVFVNGMAVCEGYSRAFQLLLYSAGVQNTLVTGNTLKSNGTPDYDSHHMWNMVRVGGVWGYTDTTWNDNGIQINGIKRTSYRWFNIPESELQYDHYVDNAFPLPSADSFDITYFSIKIQMLADGQPADELTKGLIASAAKESKSYVEILCIMPNAINAQTLTRTINTAMVLAEINAELGRSSVRSVVVEKRSTRYFIVYWN